MPINAWKPYQSRILLSAQKFLHLMYVLLTLGTILVYQQGIRAESKPNSEKIRITVPDMHCTGCANSIREKLSKEPHVTSSRFDFAQKQVTISTSGGSLSDERIKEIVEKLSYHVTTITREPL